MKSLGIRALGDLQTEAPPAAVSAAEPSSGVAERAGLGRPSVGVQSPGDRGWAPAQAALLATSADLVRSARAVSEALNRQHGVTGSGRAILRELVTHGPLTVPALARGRGVTRQRVQTLVSALVEAGYVELVDNPAHKRSRLARSTARGLALLERLERREREELALLKVAVSDAELRRAVAVLQAVSEAFADHRPSAAS
jgi:DNA-binding MarR family transcriptional regulator